MQLQVLGIRGIPANHGGFETFAEKFAQYLVEQGWQVVVYCQEEGSGDPYDSIWNDILLIHIPVKGRSALSSILFDLKSSRMATKRRWPVLTLGYNTAVFSLRYRAAGLPHVMNMDGLEWKRQKWNFFEKCWLRLNEQAGCLLANHLIADHPVIAAHLAKYIKQEKISTIPYSANPLTDISSAPLETFNVKPGQYLLCVARPEPENSLLEIVSAFTASPRGVTLVVLGNYLPKENAYHASVLDAANEEVIFPGAIFEKSVVEALRFHCCFYIHGHQVGGTNPSLLESLAAGTPVLSHDNPFNRWVAGEAGRYFNSESTCEKELTELLDKPEEWPNMKNAALQRVKDDFSESDILGRYEDLLIEIMKTGRKR